LPVYSYKGVNNAGRATRGFVDADSDRSARQKLRREGLYLTELLESTGSAPAKTEESSSRFSFSFTRSIPGGELSIATRQLATLLGAGIPLVESLGALTEQVEHLLAPAHEVGVVDVQVERVDAPRGTSRGRSTSTRSPA
jgi:general secretion pathway protein F